MNIFEAILHQSAAGLATGGIYALFALSLVMTHQSSRHVNLAQGEMAMISTYLAWGLISVGVPYWPAFVITLAASFVFGSSIHLLVFRHLRHASALTHIIGYVGLMVILNSIAGWIFGYTVRPFPSPFPASSPGGNTLLSWHELGLLLVCTGLLLLLFCFLRFTKVGLAMQAAAENPTSSRLVGIHVSTMLMLGWGLAASTGAAAGMMLAPIVYLEPNMMSGTLIYGLAAALLGGIDSPWGAVVGGLMMGVAENLVGTFLFGPQLKLSIALLAIVGVLLIRPSGLFGKRYVVRV